MSAWANGRGALESSSLSTSKAAARSTAPLASWNSRCPVALYLGYLPSVRSLISPVSTSTAWILLGPLPGAFTSYSALPPGSTSTDWCSRSPPGSIHDGDDLRCPAPRGYATQSAGRVAVIDPGTVRTPPGLASSSKRELCDRPRDPPLQRDDANRVVGVCVEDHLLTVRRDRRADGPVGIADRRSVQRIPTPHPQHRLALVSDTYIDQQRPIG